MPKPAKRIVLGLLIAWAVLPEWPRIPVEGASARDWNPRTFWFEPWGRSGVHKGIDIFARSGTPVRSASYGLVLYRGEIALGGKVVLVLAPKWRLHYYAHLDSLDAYPGQPVLAGSRLGTVGTTGNAAGTPPHSGMPAGRATRFGSQSSSSSARLCSLKYSSRISKGFLSRWRCSFSSCVNARTLASCCSYRVCVSCARKKLPTTIDDTNGTPNSSVGLWCTFARTRAHIGLQLSGMVPRHPPGPRAPCAGSA